jgi:hypothetical protein
MRASLRRFGIAAAMLVAIGGTTVALPDAAQARWGGGGHGGGWHGGGWRGGDGWGWGGFGVGVGTGLLLGAATAPYWGGYGYDPGYGYGPYDYGYGYGPYYGGYAGGPYYAAYGAPYAGGCYVTRRWVSDHQGHRVWRRVRICR